MAALHEHDRVRMRLFAHDAVVGTGHTLDSAYVEQFWLPHVGPTSIVVLRWAGRELDELLATDVVLADLAVAMGLSAGTARHSPLVRTLARLEQFHCLQYVEDPPLVLFRRTLPTLTRGRVLRMPVRLQAAHAEHLARLVTIARQAQEAVS